MASVTRALVIVWRKGVSFGRHRPDNDDGDIVARHWGLLTVETWQMVWVDNAQEVKETALEG